MRIGFDVRAMQTSGTSATRGIGRYTIDLLEGLLRFFPEDRVVLFGMAGRPVPRDWGDRCEVVEIGGEAVHEAVRPWYLQLPKVRSMASLVDAWQEGVLARHGAAFVQAVDGAKVDVVYFPTGLDIGCYPEVDFKPPAVATFLDAIPLVHREQYYDNWLPIQRRIYDRQLANLKGMAMLIAISETSRADAIRYGDLSPERVEVVYPAVDPAFGIPVDPAVKQQVRAKLSLSDPFVLFCSAPDPHKNAARVVAAFAAVRNELPHGTKLAFIAPQVDWAIDALDKAAGDAGLDRDAMVITGRLTDEEVVVLFQEALCLASPSLIEGFGLPAAQSLAAGVPAIVTHEGSLPEVVGDAGLLVDPLSVPEIAEAIRKAATDEPLRKSLIAAGLERASRFEPERQARGVHEILAKAARAR